MAEGFRSGICSTTGNWWSNNTTASPCSTAITDMGVNISYGSSTWSSSSDQMVEMNVKALSSSTTCEDTSIAYNHHQDHKSSQESDSVGDGGGAVLMDSTLQMMDFGLSCPNSDHWSQALLHGRSTESNYSSMLEESAHNQKNYSDSSSNNIISGLNKQIINQVFTLEQQQQQQHDHLSPSSSTTTTTSSFLQGLFEPSDHHHQHHLQHQHQLAPPYVNALPHQFLKTSPPKQQLHFSNNTTFWNPSASAAMTNNINSGFFPSPPSSQTQLFEEKPNFSNLTLKPNREEVREKKSNSTSTESTFKRPRIETPTPLPTFKVRKEKLGDRITALQQLVSPFGKTDTASVLFEAIEYIKFLHEQVGALSTPYMKSGSSHSIQYQQNSDKSKDGEGSKQDLRSRGLCLVPISSTYPVATETSADFWTPTFGGTYR